jgi:hypothetical protein
MLIVHLNAYPFSSSYVHLCSGGLRLVFCQFFWLENWIGKPEETRGQHALRRQLRPVEPKA